MTAFWQRNSDQIKAEMWAWHLEKEGKQEKLYKSEHRVTASAERGERFD